MFFGAFYAIGGLVIVWTAFALDYPYLAYPFIMGFALFAPFGAAGTYEISRRLESGEPLSWPAILGAVWSRTGMELGWLALVSLFTLIIWLDLAVFVFLAFYGADIPSFPQLFANIFTTAHGLAFLLVGNVARRDHRALRLFDHRDRAASRRRSRGRFCDRDDRQRARGSGQSAPDAGVGDRDRRQPRDCVRHRFSSRSW